MSLCSFKKVIFKYYVKDFYFWLLFVVKKIWFFMEVVGYFLKNCNEDKENIYKYYLKSYSIVFDDWVKLV